MTWIVPALAIVFFLLAVIFANLTDVEDIISGHKEAKGALEALCVFSCVLSACFFVLSVAKIVSWFVAFL